MTRIFVAAVPSAEAVAHLDDFLAVRRDAAAYRWTGPDQWHLTLAFAEDVAGPALDAVTEGLQHAAGRRRSVRVRLAGGGAFPHADRARVLLTRVDTDEAGRGELGLLAAGVRTALARAGARVDGQRFRPHVTLARLPHPENVTSWVRLLDAYQGPEWDVDEVVVVASYLGEGPRRRPRYEVLETHRLA